MTRSTQRPWWRISLFVFIMLLIEFLDEFAYSSLEAARPLIRDSFDLNYLQISLITTIPLAIAIVVEPVIGLMFNSGRRKVLIVLGCIAFGVGIIIQGLSPAFWLFVLGASIQAPASGVFVNLAQASLMDRDPTRRENSMALWTFSGSLAVVIGPITLSAVVFLGSSWRALFVVTGMVCVLIALWIARTQDAKGLSSATTESQEDNGSILSFRENARIALQLLKERLVWRWLLLLEISNLMLDVLFGLLALYFVDVIGISATQAGFAIAVWTGVGLLGDFLLIPLLERMRGLVYLRYSALIILILYPLFLLVGSFWIKLVFLALIGLFNAGWYAILQGKLYDQLGENSGSILVIGNVTGLFTALIPLLLGTIAETYGLTAAMWSLVASPAILFLALLGQKQIPQTD